MKSGMIDTLWDDVAAKTLSGGLTIARKIADEFARKMVIAEQLEYYQHDFVFDVEQFADPIQRFLNKIIGDEICSPSILTCAKSDFFLRGVLLHRIGDWFLMQKNPGVSAYATHSIKVANTTIYSFSFGSRFVSKMFEEFKANTGGYSFEMVTPDTIAAERVVMVKDNSFVLNSEAFMTSQVTIAYADQDPVIYSLSFLTLLASLIKMLEVAVLRVAFESSLAVCGSKLIMKSETDKLIESTEPRYTRRSMWKLEIDAKNKIGWNRYLDNDYVTHEGDSEAILFRDIPLENMLLIQHIAG